MRTVGEILKKARKEQNLSFEEVEQKTKIRRKFLIALEDNNWKLLPSLPYIKGFIRNYSLFLGLKPDEMIAIFRRQFSLEEKKGLLPKGITSPLNQPFIKLTPQFIAAVITAFFILILFGYLFGQYQAFVSPPNLIVSKPQEGEIITSQNVQVKGKTDEDAVISINGQKIALLENGEFSVNLDLSPGINTIVIESTSKYGKTKSITRTIQTASDQQ